jgi:hypothetical protein
MLIDALSDLPASVIVCDKVDGQSRFERLEKTQLHDRLEKYSLGQISN